MKKLIIFAVLFAVSIAISAQQTLQNDTILSVMNVKDITITESKAGLKVSIKGIEADSTYISTFEDKYSDDTVIKSKQIFTAPWSKSKTNSVSMTCGGLMFGFVSAPGMPHDIDIEMSKSYEIGILNLLGVKFQDKYFNNSFSVGFGLNWKNFRTTKNTRFAPRFDNGVTIENYPQDTKAKYSRIKVFSLNFPVIYKHTFTKSKNGNSKFAISAGAIFNYNTHASLASSWLTADGNEVEESTNHIGHRKFTIDLIGIINLTSDLGIYAKYCPMNTLRDGRGLDFNSFSTGIILAY